MIYLLVILFGLPCILLTLDFVKYLFNGSRLYNITIQRVLDVMTMIGLPVFYLVFFDGETNDCCGETSTFSPGHKTTILIWIIICIITYFYSSFKSAIAPPVVEVAMNALLLLGFSLNGIICYHVFRELHVFTLFGSLPIAILFIIQLSENHKKILQKQTEGGDILASHPEKIALKFLQQNIFLKIPILLVLCLPLVFVMTSLLMLFGQKPDAFIRAFTDTYKHGFSTLDHLCDNVECGGHFLFSVAANGHSKFVKPLRYGERAGNKIICNRQLLVANAFEELIQQKLPVIHKAIRHQYNKVGSAIHKHYRIFNNKFLADSIYVLMKPFEMIFLLTLYTFDKQPENRIAVQYLNSIDRHFITQYELDS